MIFTNRCASWARASLFLTALGASALTSAAGPQVLNHQGRIAVDGVNFNGSGLFKFALVNAAGNVTYWSNDGTGAAGSQPSAAVTLTVAKGLYAVLLGDSSLANMGSVPPAVFVNSEIYLRVWFNDGSNGFQQLGPDQRLAAAPYAMMAEKAAAASEANLFSGTLAGDVTGTQGATAIAEATVTGKALTGFVSGAGTLSAADTILSAINKLHGNNALKANLASPTFSGTVTSPAFSGPLTGNVTGNVSGSAGSFSGTLVGDVTGTQGATAIAPGTVTGKLLTGLGTAAGASGGTVTAADTILIAINRLNANDALKANLASPAFTGTVSLPAGTADAAPLRLSSGSNLTTPVLGAVEFDGTSLYLTTNAASPARKTLAFTDAALPLTSLTAIPSKPVVAWGDNDSGQATVPALANVVQVAAGSGHSLALLGNGSVVTWGDGAAVPVDLTLVTAVSAGSAHDLARLSNGTVRAWGNNGSGQTTVPSITTATQVAAGELHSLALLANGTVLVWGDNTSGQSTVPAGLTGVTAIAAGYRHSLALKSDGSVVAWGLNSSGQATVPSTALSGVVAIAAGAHHSLALKGNGTVVAWGWNSGGQSDVPATLTGVAKISGGYIFSMALKSDGTVVLWGDNTHEQITAPTSATAVSQIAAGGNHALALRNTSTPAQLARLDEDNVFAGRVGVGRTAVANALEVEGDASKTTASNWLANSDRRIKTDIAPITGALDKLAQVRLVDFRYTPEYRAAHPVIEDRRYPNVIAQEFAEVFPDQVQESGELMADGSPILQVDTYPLTIYTAAAVQELQRENAQLKERLQQQEARLQRLEALLAK